MAYGFTDQIYQSSFNKIALSVDKQADITTAADLDYASVFEVTYPNYSPSSIFMDNGRMNGKEEPTILLKSGNDFNMVLQHSVPDADMLALLLAYGLGGTHTVTAPETGVYNYSLGLADKTHRTLPFMTVGYRYGETIGYEQYIGVVANSFTLQQGSDRGSFLTMNTALMGTGERNHDPSIEYVVAGQDDTTLTLVAGTIRGATDAARMQSIHYIRAESVPSSGVYDTPVAFSECPTAATITITALGGGTADRNFMVVYNSAEADADWAGDIDDAVLGSLETPFRLGNLTDLKFGGTWNGSSYVGGSTFDCEFGGFSWTLNNNSVLQAKPGGSGDYSDCLKRGTRTQSVTLGRHMIDWLFKTYGDNLLTTSLYLKWTGAEIGDTGKYRELEIIFPKMKFSKVDSSNDAGFNAESINLIPLEGTYRTVIVRCQCALAGIHGVTP